MWEELSVGRRSTYLIGFRENGGRRCSGWDALTSASKGLLV